jgi:hypothetical protein
MKKPTVPSILVAVMLLAIAAMAEAHQPTKVARLRYLSDFLRLNLRLGIVAPKLSTKV